MDVQDTTTPTETLDGLRPQRRRRRSERTSQPRWLRRARKRLGRIHWRALGLLLIAAVAVVLVASIALATDAESRVRSSVESVNRLVTSLARKPGTELTLADFDRLQASVDDLVTALDAAERQTRFLTLAAPLSPDLSSRLETVTISKSLSLAGQSMLTGLRPTLFFLVGGEVDETVVSQISSGERIIELLSLGRGQFLRANSSLEDARARLMALDLATLSPDALLAVEALSKAEAQLQEINNLLLVGPELLTTALGLAEEQSYLVLAQNNDELRPSGGYISTYGWMTIRSGRVVDYDYSATTATSPFPPSNETALPFVLPDWWIRYENPIYAAWDGSWSPDFPTTAEMALWYYNTGNNPRSPVSGVLAIDLVGFEYILSALGEVTVPEYERTVTASNFREVIYDIRAMGAGERAHKQFLIALYRQLFADWRSVDDADTGNRLLGAVLQGLREGHLMLYFADDRLNEAVELLGWSGSQQPGVGHDYLMAADANLGNKSNRSVVRQVTYDVEILSDGRLQGRVAINYDYPASLAENDPAVDPEYHGPLDYANLLQLYLPAQSTVETGSEPTSSMHLTETDDHVLLTQQFTVEYDTVERLQVAYTTPPLVENLGPYQRYRLLIEKQPGTRTEAFSVQIALPPGAQVVSVSPPEATRYQLDQPILEFRLTPVSDQWIDVVYRSE